VPFLSPGRLPAEAIVDPAVLGRVKRGKRYRSVGWLGALSSVGVYAALRLAALSSNAALAVAGTVVVLSAVLINWTRIWVRESREPFQFTFSIGDFEAGPGADAVAAGTPGQPLDWLQRDLVEKLGERVKRLSLLDEEAVPPDDPEEEPAPHVHISGWYGPRRTAEGSWILEVVPKVRLGGPGASAKLARTVRFGLGRRKESGTLPTAGYPPQLDHDQYARLFERIYWSVASEIYAQIRHGVEQKVGLLPPGRLRAAAYLCEADDYATSNTLDAYEMARKFYRRAQETYDVDSRHKAATHWRRASSRANSLLARQRAWLRCRAAAGFRRFGRRDILTARAKLGYARMVTIELHLRALCGTVPKEQYDAAPNARRAIEQLERVPSDVPERQVTLFRGYVTLAAAYCYLQDQPGAEAALDSALQLRPATASQNAEYLFAAAMVEADQMRSLRLLAGSVELNPAMERARFVRAQRLEALWRRRDPIEPEVALTVDDEYAAVITINPGNISAWANRGYIGWLLADHPPPAASSGVPELSWKERALASLESGRQYKEVRREAMVAELDWSLARFAAEDGDFQKAYAHYIDAVSAMLYEPRLNILQHFYTNSTEALLQRYTDYRERVLAHASSAEAEQSYPQRLVESVVAFVETDYGLALAAHCRRTGKAKLLDAALDCFQNAVSKNPNFVLPHFYLSSLYRQRAGQERRNKLEQAVYLNEALAHLSEVLHREPEWIFARREMVWAESRLAELAIQFSRSGQGDDALGSKPHELMHSLVPHVQFRTAAGRGTVIGSRGLGVRRLVLNRRIEWSQDFDEVHVAVLALWVKLLAEQEPLAAVELSAHMRLLYYPAAMSLVEPHQKAARSLLSGDIGSTQRRRLRSVERECNGLIDAHRRAMLGSDPSNYAYLRAIDHFPNKERREALYRALNADPSKVTRLWIGKQLANL
jgi:hypothetical protein